MVIGCPKCVHQVKENEPVILILTEWNLDNCLSERSSNTHEKDLKLFDNTVSRIIHAISKDMQIQLKSDLETCDWFSLQLDESGISRTAQ